MSARPFDVVVVGGGIHGVGIAQAVAAAGHSVQLLEQNGLGTGTSSKSSKLIHGGLRYLESYEFDLVRECLLERALLLKVAPDLVKLQKFCVPVYKGMRRSPLLLRAGLILYYGLSGFDRNARFDTLPRGRWDELDGLRTDQLRAVFRYTDARTDDRLLTQAVMRSAMSLGAELACPAEFTGADIRKDGVNVRYRDESGEHESKARVLVNAGGPWVNRVAGNIGPDLRTIPVELVAGTHIEVPGDSGAFSLPTDSSGAGKLFYYMESPRDGRAVFVMPRGGRLMIGTTETKFKGDPNDVRPHPHEETYLLNVASHYFPALGKLSRGDIVASWAGARVLPTGEGHAFHRSRETILYPDRDKNPRVLSIYGGKLTSYRHTAERALKEISASLPDRKAVASTRELPVTPE